MDPWGTPALTGYSCEDFPSRTTQSHLLLRKSAVVQEALKPYWKLVARPHLYRWSITLLFTSFPKTLLTTGRQLTGW